MCLGCRCHLSRQGSPGDQGVHGARGTPAGAWRHGATGRCDCGTRGARRTERLHGLRHALKAPIRGAHIVLYSMSVVIREGGAARAAPRSEGSDPGGSRSTSIEPAASTAPCPVGSAAAFWLPSSLLVRMSIAGAGAACDGGGGGGETRRRSVVWNGACQEWMRIRRSNGATKQPLSRGTCTSSLPTARVLPAPPAPRSMGDGGEVRRDGPSPCDASGRRYLPSRPAKERTRGERR